MKYILFCTYMYVEHIVLFYITLITSPPEGEGEVL